MKSANKKMRKSITAMILTLCLASSVCAFTVYDRDNERFAAGELYCDGTWSSNCEATTHSTEYSVSTNDYIYVQLEFDEYNSDFDALYKNISSSDEYALNEISVSGTGWCPDNIYGSHCVRRGGETEYANTSISKAQLLKSEGNSGNN